MRFWIDTEFNEYKGALISMALVADDGREWYEALPCPRPGSWVAAHVMPFIGKEPLTDGNALAESLREFLAKFDSAHIVADWPEDISFFCLISPQAQQAHVVSYLLGKMDASLAEEMRHVDQPRAISEGSVDGGVLRALRQ